ncbi:MAG: 30S ribosomal protein S21 [Planctomycetota bacterium]|jgi:small subunit ribosomal protein S21
MIRVQVRPNEPLEAALRRFKRQCNFAGIFRLAKKYNYHEKRSDRMRRERRERLRTLQRAERRLRGPRSGGRGRRRQRTRVSRVRPGDKRAEDDEKGAPEGISAVPTTPPTVTPPTAPQAVPPEPPTQEPPTPEPPDQGSGGQGSSSGRPTAEASAE